MGFFLSNICKHTHIQSRYAIRKLLLSCESCLIVEFTIIFSIQNVMEFSFELHHGRTAFSKITRKQYIALNNIYLSIFTSFSQILPVFNRPHYSPTDITSISQISLVSRRTSLVSCRHYLTLSAPLSQTSISSTVQLE